MKMLKEDIKMTVFAVDMVVFTGKLLKMTENVTRLVDMGYYNKIKCIFIYQQLENVIIKKTYTEKIYETKSWFLEKFNRQTSRLIKKKRKTGSIRMKEETSLSSYQHLQDKGYCDFRPLYPRPRGNG